MFLVEKSTFHLVFYVLQCSTIIWKEIYMVTLDFWYNTPLPPPTPPTIKAVIPYFTFDPFCKYYYPLELSTFILSHIFLNYHNISNYVKFVVQENVFIIRLSCLKH